MELNKKVNVTLTKTIKVEIDEGSICLDDLTCIFGAEQQFQKDISINGYLIRNNNDLKKALQYFKMIGE